MYQVFYKYLILNKRISVPGVGVFVLEREPARLDMENKVIHAPLTVIKLRKETTETTDDFYHFLANELKTDVPDATRRFEEFSYRIKAEVRKNKSFVLPGLGTLTPDATDEIRFESSEGIKEYFPSIAIDTTTTEVRTPVTIASPQHEDVVITDEYEAVEETRKRRDLWWVFAIILALVGVGAIVYYYYYYKPVQY